MRGTGWGDKSRLPVLRSSGLRTPSRDERNRVRPSTVGTPLRGHGSWCPPEGRRCTKRRLRASEYLTRRWCTVQRRAPLGAEKPLAELASLRRRLRGTSALVSHAALHARSGYSEHLDRRSRKNTEHNASRNKVVGVRAVAKLPTLVPPPTSDGILR